jgi:hypothetical protein
MPQLAGALSQDHIRQFGEKYTTRVRARTGGRADRRQDAAQLCLCRADSSGALLAISPSSATIVAIVTADPLASASFRKSY